MSLLEPALDQIRSLLAESAASPAPPHTASTPGPSWPPGGQRHFILQQDTAIELGPPGTESLAFAVWTRNLDKIRDKTFTRIGPRLVDLIVPDRPRTAAGEDDPLPGTDPHRIVPFGQIAIVGIDADSGEDEYQIFQQLEAVKYQIDLEGYMRRGAPQFLREWSRVSRRAIQRGFSLSVLASEWDRRYRRVPFVKAVELLFITDPATLHALRPVVSTVRRLLEALNKMMTEALQDCDHCDYRDVCNQVTALKSLRRRNDR
jgi:hypothetical protein